jgi:Acyltransferase family.
VCSTFLFARYFSLSSGFLKRIFDGIETSKLGSAINSISKTSYGIYLCHVMIIILLQHFLKPYSAQFGNMIYFNLILILTIIIPWAIIVILSRIPYLKKVSGAG